MQVAAKQLLLAQLAEIGLRRRDHAHVDRDLVVGAQALDLAFLQHAQELHLEAHGHALDLVEQQGAAVGMLELADPLLGGIGEGADLMAEQLALEQRLGQAAAIDRDEVAFAPLAVVVQAARDELLARSGLADDHHVGRGGGKLLHLALQELHGRGTSEQGRLDAALGRELAPQGQHLGAQHALFHGTGGHFHQTFGCERLLEEIVGAGAHRLDGKVHVAVGRDENHRYRSVDLQRVLASAPCRPCWAGERR